MKLAARQMGSMKAVKESLKKGGSSGETWIKNIPAEGLTVRFLTEPEQWFGYFEYYDADAKAYIPMAEGEVLPDGARQSFRYLTNAVDIESDRVIPLKLPKTAANALIMKYDKYGTLIDRDYELERFGEGLDTSYDVTPTAPAPMAVDKYTALQLEEVLIAARNKALGEDDIDTKDEPFPTADIDDDDVAIDEVEEDGVEADDETVEVSEENLRLLSIRELRLVALDHDVDPRGKTKAELVDALIEAAER